MSVFKLDSEESFRDASLNKSHFEEEESVGILEMLEITINESFGSRFDSRSFDKSAKSGGRDSAKNRLLLNSR